MKIVILGATGMVGHGALHAALRDDDVAKVTVISRRPLTMQHPKLDVVLHQDFTDLKAVTEALGHVDACFFCIGMSSTGRTEADYTTVTYDYAIAAADAVSPLNPDLTFVYVSGEGADSASRVMWQRVKGRAEDALLAYPFRTHVFRPGYIRPMHGARPSGTANRIVYGATSWLYPVLRRVFPKAMTTTDAIGRAMLAVCRQPAPPVLRSNDINRFAGV
jgi:uncharacterized protein YbjT (DUF2867 family)